MKIRSIEARPILDSRGLWTIEVALTLANGVRAVASVPQGKSTGSSEAVALPADAAARAVNRIIAKSTSGKTFASQAAFDARLIALDGTPDKSKLGANAVLAASIAFLRASSVARHRQLWREIWSELSDSNSAVHPALQPRRPHLRLFMNMVNGGLHAGNNLRFQEYLAIPKTDSIRNAIDIGTRLYRELGDELARRRGPGARNIGDEGGYAPDFADDLEPFRIMRAAVRRLKLGAAFDYGLDAAATDIRTPEQKIGGRDVIVRQYESLTRTSDFIYLEDPFDENAFDRFAEFASRIRLRRPSGRPLWISGDDLTTTNVGRMERAYAAGSVNAVIIKPNQIGSVTEALDAVRAARRYGWGVIVSHRSGETNDDFIADFAWGVGADGLKLGAPARGERIAKYNRLLEIAAA